MGRAPSRSFYLRLQYDFSELARRRVWKGDPQQRRNPCFRGASSCAPLHGWFSGFLAEYMNDTGKVARVMQEDRNAPANKPELPLSR